MLTALFWGGNAIAGQLAVGEISPLLLVAIRWVIVSVVLSSIYWRQLLDSWPIIRANLMRITLMAGLGFAGFNSLFYIASHQTTGINIGILQGSIPMIVLIGSAIAYKSRIGPLQQLGVLVTLLGVIIVAAHGDLQRLMGLQFNPGDAIMLAACVLYSGYTVALKSKPQMPGLVFLAWLSIVAALASLPLALLEWWQGDAIWPSAKGWMVTSYVALFPSFLAQLFFIRGVEMIGPERAGIFVNLVPVFAALLAVMILGEAFQLFHALALLLVLFGIWLAERNKFA